MSAIDAALVARVAGLVLIAAGLALAAWDVRRTRRERRRWHPCMGMNRPNRKDNR